MNITPAGGLTDLGALVLAAIFLICLIITILGIRRAIKRTDGAALPIWILLIILFMPLGGVLALIAIKEKSA